MAIDWIQIGEVSALIYLGGTRILDRVREKNAIKNGLKPNPTRCQEHADAINGLRNDVRAIKEHLNIV